MVGYALDTNQQNSIINHVEKIYTEDEDGFVIETEKSNAIEVLVHTILMHFVGNPTEELESKRIILTNLRCPTLGDFKWYKDVFITNIFLRPDCNQPFWKERFISGLPNFFAEKVINKLKEISGGQPVPWNNITYGQLFAFVKKIGLSICQEQKDKKRNDKFKFKVTMGSFCEQYGYETFNPPSRVKRIKHRHRRSNQIEYHNKRRNFNNKSNNQKYSKNQHYSKNKRYNTTNKQKIVCWNCKRPGHRSTECKMKKKINEIFQDQPDIQEKLSKLLLSESESSEDSDNEYSINEIGNSSDSSSESQELSDNLCNCKIINVITKEDDKQFLLEIIDKIDDPNTKREYLIKLKDMINRENTRESPQPFISTGELQNEIKQIKSQIKHLQDIVNDQDIKQLQINARLSLIESKNNNNTQASSNRQNLEINEEQDSEDYIQIINKINYQKWYTNITLHIGNDFKLNIIALMDTGADYNCIREGVIPTKYYEKTTERLSGANGSNLKVQYKLPCAKICNQGYCFKNQFILVKNLSQEVILGTPFFTQIYPFKVTEQGISTKVVGTKLLFNFLSPMKTKEILNLQQNTINKTINLIK
ncbi:hypothetical protein EUTSA_v10005523mg, partial [Eutrema salsugineum]